MAKNRYINTHFWKDTYTGDLDPSEKLLFLYFISNPLTNLSGVYEIRLKEVAMDTGFDIEMIKKILARFEVDEKIFYKNGWVCVPNALKHQKLNGNMKKSVCEALSLAPVWTYERLRKALKGFEILSHLNLNLNLNLNTNSNTKSEEGVSFVPYGKQKESHSATNGMPVNAERQIELDATLETIAKLVGAKSAGTIADNRWTQTAIKITDEGFSLADIENGYRRMTGEPKFNPEYFTPPKFLEYLQREKSTITAPSKPTLKRSDFDSDDEYYEAKGLPSREEIKAERKKEREMLAKEKKLA